MTSINPSRRSVKIFLPRKYSFYIESAAGIDIITTIIVVCKVSVLGGSALFKVGDRVRCVDPCEGLMKDKVYTVSFAHPVFLGLDGSIVSQWYIERFELVEESPAQDYMELFV